MKKHMSLVAQRDKQNLMIACGDFNHNALCKPKEPLLAKFIT
jgi:hypothetical protein